MPLPPRAPIRSLTALCVALLATHSDNLRDLGGLPEHLGVALLREVVARQRLTLPLARVFIRGFPGTELARALEGLDLFAAIPTHAGSGTGRFGLDSW